MRLLGVGKAGYPTRPFAGDWLQPQRQLLLAVVVVAVLSAVALGWLGWLLLEQDAGLERQRRADRLQQAADTTAAAMRVAVAGLPARAAQAAAATPSPADGLLRAALEPGGVTVRNGGHALWVPGDAGTTDTSPAFFGDGEVLEFGGDLQGALRAYQRVADEGRDGRVAPALARVARVQRKLGRAEAALATYDTLARRGQALVDGLPAALVARVGRASVFEAAGRAAALRSEATALRDDLLGGRWPLTRAQFTFYSDQAAAWLGTPVTAPAHDRTRAEALEWAWEQVRAAREPGTRALRFAEGPALVAWSPHPAGVHVIVADGQYLASTCAAGAPEFRCAVHDGDGRWLAGANQVDGPSSRLTADASGSTWSVRVAPVAADAPEGSPRRMLLASTVALAGLVLAAGWYFILRGMARERAAGRAQADFVAAVSHEFRSPLTSMSHIAEMLQSGRIGDGLARTSAYDVLVHDTDRLRTLVEQLLEFGRFEAGGPVLRRDRLDLAEAVRAIVDDFGERVARDGYTVEYDGPSSPMWMEADREALTLALWNLMDNAVKYSPDVKTIWVRLRRTDAGVELAVRDEGLGVPEKEQAAIFRQFVRGEEPKSRRIRGTGIGLALVRHIARAHGGDVSVESEPGRGSMFTLRIRR